MFDAFEKLFFNTIRVAPASRSSRGFCSRMPKYAFYTRSARDYPRKGRIAEGLQHHMPTTINFYTSETTGLRATGMHTKVRVAASSLLLVVAVLLAAVSMEDADG